MITVNFLSKPKFTYPRRKFLILVKSICKRFRVSNAVVNILITDNRQIRSFNKKFHHRNAVTDCLSFDLSHPSEKYKTFDIIVNAQRAKSESKKRGHSADAELALYIIHGLLHNLGFDDLAPKKAKLMHQTEDQILHQQGFGKVYVKPPRPQKAGLRLRSRDSTRFRRASFLR
jgi:probable rRNA maturation factor